MISCLVASLLFPLIVHLVLVLILMILLISLFVNNLPHVDLNHHLGLLLWGRLELLLLHLLLSFFQ